MQKLLIVDDVPVNIEVLAGLLEQPMYQILKAGSGQEAINITREQQPDLILLDVSMPEMDGYQVCSQLKHDPLTRDIPIIFVTANVDEDSETQGLEMGAVDYITKPIRPAILQARVRTHLELKRQRDVLALKCDLDALTTIANRRLFDETLYKEWARAQRDGHSIALIMADVDYFKSLNDEHGHLVGDECLKQIASALDFATERPTDLAARYGGDEFACVLPNTDIEGAVSVAEKIRQSIIALEITFMVSHIKKRLTMSLGVACITPSKENSYKTLIDSADKALYSAKKKGRNNVFSHVRD
ncbi:diguanylate cyclase domain-containing protein [Pseudomonadota bacterium]